MATPAVATRGRKRARVPAAPAPFRLTGDSLAAVLSFCNAQELTYSLSLVNRAFRACIATSPLAWPPTLDLGFILYPRPSQRRIHRGSDASDSETEHEILPLFPVHTKPLTRPPDHLARVWALVRRVRFDYCSPFWFAHDQRLLVTVIGLCPRLEAIEGWMVSTRTADAVARCSALRRMSLNIDERDPPADCARMLKALTAGCPDLRDLALCGSAAAASVAQIMNGFPRLERLRVASRATLNSDGMRAIRGASLRDLTLDGVNDSDLAIIASGCPQLRELSIRGPLISDAGLIALGSACRDLRALKLSDDGNDPLAISDAGIAALAQSCPSLEQLMSECPLLSVTDASFTALARACPRLHSITAAGWGTDSGVSALAAACPSLRALHLPNCKRVTDAALIALSAHCAKLEELDLSSCARVTDVGAVALARGCPALRVIVLAGSAVGDKGVQAIASSCSDLRSVSLSKHSSKGSLAALTQCPHLRVVSVDARKKVAENALLKLLEMCRCLREVEISVRDDLEAIELKRFLLPTASARGIELDVMGY
jgi:hypothetical protein